MENLKCIKRKRTKFILAFISSVFNALASALITGLGNIAVYILSYIHYKQEWVDMQYGNLMVSVMCLSLALFSPLSGPLETKCGPIISIIISSVIIELSVYLFYLQQNIWYFYGITVLTGIGSGLSANILLKNICFFYPKKKGLVSSLLLSFNSISTAVVSLLGEQIVNPRQDPIIDKNKAPYYSLEISQNVIKYYILTMIAFPAFNLLSIIFFYKYNPDCEEEEGEKKQNENDEKTEKKEEMNEELINENDNQRSTFYKKASKTKVKKALKSFRFWRNIMIVILLPFYYCIFSASFRAYIPMIISQEVIYYTNFGLGITIFIVGPIWASFVDKFGFQPIMKIIGFIVSGISIYFFFFIDNGYPYLVGFFVFSVAITGISVAIIPHFMNVFGMSNFLILAGFGTLCTQLSNFLAALISIVISIFCKKSEEFKWPYRIVSIAGGALCIIGLVMVFYENDEKFDYGDENEEKKDSIKDDDNKTIEMEKDVDKKYYKDNAGTILDPSNNTTIVTNNN